MNYGTPAPQSEVPNHRTPTWVSDAKNDRPIMKNELKEDEAEGLLSEPPVEIIKFNGKKYMVVNERPQSGDFYTYLGFNEPITVEKANWNPNWMEKCWDRDNYYKCIEITTP